jgi:hypothetical protein
MGRERSSDSADAYVQGLEALYEDVGREFDFHDGKVLRLEKRIAELHAELEAAQAERAAEEERAGQFASFGIEIGEALKAAREGAAQDPALTPQVARMTRRGPVGIRSAILEVMARRADEAWSPEQVRSDLALRSITKTGRNVGQTMRNMVADGQLERVGRAAYRLLPGQRR